MADVAATMKVLESDTESLLGGTPKIDEETEEFADLSKDTPTDDTPDDKPAAKKEEKPAAQAGDDDAELPEPLRGKSRKELARMYQEAHQTIGRQGTELGEFRRKADLLIQASLAQLQKDKKPADTPAKPVEIEDSEFIANPKAALDKYLENHPLIRGLKENQGQLAADRQRTAMQANADKFNATHPDAGTILQDPEFRAWVDKSPVRRNLLRRAHERYDFAAGDEVFSTWKELKSLRTPKPSADAEPNPTTEAAKTLAAAAKAKREAKAKDAAAPTGGGGSAPEGKKKIFRRSEVLRMMEEQPDRYAAMADEIALAYAEKRVR